MGMNFPLASLLAWARRKRGLAAGDVITMGRLELTMSPNQARAILRRVGGSVDQAVSGHAFAESFIQQIVGATSVAALDVSTYQGATIEHDLSAPIPPHLRHGFDLLLDGGTLEHVFNVPVALRNYQDLVRPGGWIAIATPANNYTGHGFYQFSPELFFTHFSRANGFRLHYVGLAVHPFPSARLSTRCRFFEVTAPDRVGSRVTLVNRSPALLLVLAQRNADSAPDSASTIQSDYRALHGLHGAGQDTPVAPSRLMRLAAALPPAIANPLRGIRELRTHSLANRRLYRPHGPDDFGE